jgi:hypothetical protein
MKRLKTRHRQGEEFPDLDALVLRELQAMVQDTTQEPAKPKPEQRQPRPQEEPVLDWDKAEDLSSSGSKDMLTEEEQQFVANTVDWLRSRDNRDIIMANIWSGVIGSDPESFYSPEETKEHPADIEDKPPAAETREGGQTDQ